MKKLFLLILIVSFSQIHAQTNNEKPCPCCTENHQEFDFWLGEWTVYNSQGKIVGKNTITKLYDDCILREEWVSTTINRGTSTNYYDSSDNTWNQVWVDNSGYSLVLKGEIIDNIMVLKSKILEGKNGKYYNQISWTPNKDGSVTQLWEIFDENNSLINEAFRGIYKKK